MFITNAIAATETATAVAPSPIAGMLTQLILVFCIFYIVLIRPQQKRMKEHDALLKSIKPKDEVVTSGGVYGKVVSATDDVLVVEIAKGVEIKVLRSTIRDVVSKN